MCFHTASTAFSNAEDQRNCECIFYALLESTLIKRLCIIHEIAMEIAEYTTVKEPAEARGFCKKIASGLSGAIRFLQDMHAAIARLYND